MNDAYNCIIIIIYIDINRSNSISPKNNKHITFSSPLERNRSPISSPSNNNIDDYVFINILDFSN